MNSWRSTCREASHDKDMPRSTSKAEKVYYVISVNPKKTNAEPLELAQEAVTNAIYKVYNWRFHQTTILILLPDRSRQSLKIKMTASSIQIEWVS
jgi:hypothetical protein